MEKSVKRTISVILVVIMVGCMMPMSALQVSAKEEISSNYYEKYGLIGATYNMLGDKSLGENKVWNWGIWKGGQEFIDNGGLVISKPHYEGDIIYRTQVVNDVATWRVRAI